MRLDPYFRPPQRAPFRPAHSTAELAREFGVTVQALAALLRRPGAPQPRPTNSDPRHKRYDAAEARAWWQEVSRA